MKKISKRNKGPWKCYHCGFVAKTEKQAEAHFGDEIHLPAMCVWWSDLPEDDRLLAYQQLTIELEETRKELQETEDKLGYLYHQGSLIKEMINKNF